ncbi:MAG: asparagine synthase C-terminal domain-containing protein [Pseudomonadota bacterium]|nr:asparagine synthase C-terminal domain-containing protein [Pseudomonadota bacterium]
MLDEPTVHTGTCEWLILVSLEPQPARLLPIRNRPQLLVSTMQTVQVRSRDWFLRLLSRSMEPTLATSGFPLVEVSGGLDSACVAVAAHSLRNGLTSYGIMLDGAVGTQQQRRRRELVELLGLTDFEFPVSPFAPFATLEDEQCAVTPFDEVYRLACLNAIDRIAERTGANVDLLVTGIGGDELTFENTFRREEWEVRGSVCTSSIIAAACRADMFMRRGIWTSNPCIAQEVVDFGRALPKKMRQNRLLNILTLARSGLSDGFLFARYFENFLSIYLRDAALYDFDQALTSSVLADYRILDVSPLLARARDATLNGFSQELATKLFLLVKLEKVLARYVG